MKKKQILVCGTGFGKIYLKAIAESKEYELNVHGSTWTFKKG